MLFAITPRRLAANRENAQKSTGPRTEEGKHRSAKNSLHHAAFAAHLLQPGEDAADLHTLRNNLLADLSPQNTLELCLADRVVSAAWRLRRLQHADRCLTEMQQLEWRAQVESYNEDLEERREQVLENTRRFNLQGTDDDDTILRTAGVPDLLPLPDPAATPDDDPPMPAPGFFLAQALRHDPTLTPDADATGKPRRHHPTTPFERLLSVEVRLHGMMARAIRDLRQLRLDRRDPARAPDPYTPFATSDPLGHEPADHADIPQAPPNDNPPPPSPKGDPQRPSPTRANAAGEGGGEGRASVCADSSSASSSKSQISYPKSPPSVPPVSSLVNPALQNEPTCHSGSSPASILARAAALSAQALPHRRKERHNPD
jgi:hypothetical protein